MKKMIVFLLIVDIMFIFSISCYAVTYEIEPNNLISQANPLSSGQSITGQLYSNQDFDCFSITTSGADIIKVSFTIEGNPTNYRWYISIQSSETTILSQKIHYDDYSNPAIELQAAVDKSGTYYIRIYTTYTYYSSADYTLTVSVSKPVDPVISDSDGDGVIDEWDKCPGTPPGSCVNREGCMCGGLYTQEQMDQMVKTILEWGDLNGDGKIGLTEAIHALQITSGIQK